MKKPERKIKQSEVDAFHKGKQDPVRNSKLRPQLSESQIRSLVTHMANGGNRFGIALKFNMTYSQITRLLESLAIRDASQARTFLLKNPVVVHESPPTNKAAEQRLKEMTEKSPLKVKIDRQAVEQKNKQDQDRACNLPKTPPKKGKQFKIPENREAEFKRLVLSGISVARRQFGGSRLDIVNEVKRLIPNLDPDILKS